MIESQKHLLMPTLVAFTVITLAVIGGAVFLQYDHETAAAKEDVTARQQCTGQYDTEECHQHRIDLLRLKNQMDDIRKKM